MLLGLFIISFLPSNLQALTPNEEKQLLLHFRDARSWSRDGMLASWEAAASMCDDWHGVACDDDGHVSYLWVGYNELTGSLPKQWSFLTSLTSLNIRKNEFTGSLPEQWSVLTGLTTM